MFIILSTLIRENGHFKGWFGRDKRGGRWPSQKELVILILKVSSAWTRKQKHVQKCIDVTEELRFQRCVGLTNFLRISLT